MQGNAQGMGGFPGINKTNTASRNVGKSLGSSPKSDSLVPSPKPQVQVPIKSKLFSSGKTRGWLVGFQAMSQVQIRRDGVVPELSH